MLEHDFQSLFSQKLAELDILAPVIIATSDGLVGYYVNGPTAAPSWIPHVLRAHLNSGNRRKKFLISDIFGKYAILHWIAAFFAILCGNWFYSSSYRENLHTTR